MDWQAKLADLSDAAKQASSSRAAAAAYCRLLLSNKLKLQGVLGPVGAALAGGSPQVAAVVRHALRQMLAAGAAAPRERARLCMDLFHQTPLSCRMQLAEVGGWGMPAQLATVPCAIS